MGTLLSMSSPPSPPVSPHWFFFVFCKRLGLIRDGVLEMALLLLLLVLLLLASRCITELNKLSDVNRSSVFQGYGFIPESNNKGS